MEDALYSLYSYPPKLKEHKFSHIVEKNKLQFRCFFLQKKTPELQLVLLNVLTHSEQTQQCECLTASNTHIVVFVRCASLLLILVI